MGSHEQQLLCSHLACRCSTSDSFWKKSMKNMSNLSRQRLKILPSLFLCWPLLNSRKSLLFILLSTLLPHPIRRVFLSFHSLQKSVQASRAFLVLCKLFLQFINCTLHLPTSCRDTRSYRYTSILFFCQSAHSKCRRMTCTPAAASCAAILPLCTGKADDRYFYHPLLGSTS